MRRRFNALLKRIPDKNSNSNQDSSSPPSYVSHTAGRIPHNERHPYPTNASSSPPTYVSNLSLTSDGDCHGERVRDWRSGISSAPSISDSDTLLDDAESSLATYPRSEGRGTLPVDLQYLYYRMYTEDGPIRSIQPLNADDPSLSRIYARSVAPPHTVASLKFRLRNVENISGNSTLYVTLSSPTPMDDDEPILFHTGASPGVTVQEPMAFVVECSDPERTTLLTVDTQTPQYVYYRVYTAGGDIPSKQPVDPNDPSLGRIRVDAIPPPRNVASMRRTISRVEKFIPSWHAKLFFNMFNKSPMNETYYPNLASDSSFSLHRPLAFVLQIYILKSRVTYDYFSGDRSFLELVEGETYYTDGILLQRPYSDYGDRDVYQAVTPAGVVGFVRPSDIEKITDHVTF